MLDYCRLWELNMRPGFLPRLCFLNPFSSDATIRSVGYGLGA
jgi:hypothetical protein